MNSLWTFVLACSWTGLVAAEPDSVKGDPSWFRPKDDKTFSLVHSPVGQPFVVNASTFCRPEEPTGASDVYVDPVFAAGKRVSFQDGMGRRLSVSRHDSLPFVWMRGTYRHDGAAPTTVHSLDFATLPLDLGSPVGELKVLGTGGLSDATSSPGSYMWIAVVDPKTRRGVVAGWLTTNRGSGVVIPKVVDNRLILSARIEYGNLRLLPSKEEVLESFVVGWFEDARIGLEAYADAVAKMHQVRLRPQPCGYCTWYHAGSSSAQRIAKLSEFAAKRLKPFGFSFVQIDDGWQAGQSKNGPRKNFTTHRPNAPFPDGMKSTAQQIAGLAMTPGIWFMPFAGTWNDPFFAERQDLFAKRQDGKPFDTFWGGSCFDLTNPKAQAFLRDNVQRLTRDWGYQYLKMDGLWTGSATDIQYVNDAYKDDKMGDAVLSNPDKTNIEALRDGLKIVRETAGTDVFLLGCCAPQNMRSYGGAFGLVDAMRIGPDNGATADALPVGPRYGSRNYFLNGRVWWNDPDPVYVRPSLSLAQAELSAAWAAIAGQLTVASDDLEQLPPPRLDVLKRVMPSHGQVARPVDLFDRELPRVWVVPPSKRSLGRTVVGLYNWDKERIVVDEPIERLGLDPKLEYAAFEFWTNKLLPAVRGRLQVSLDPLGNNKSASEERSSGQVRRSCAALVIRPATNHPQLLSTSRHVTQGLVDVVKEEWDEKSRKLSGVSRVVEGDPYELRILTRSTGRPWKAADLNVSAADADDGVTFAVSADDGELIRATINSKNSREVKWSVQFAQAAP